MNSVSWQLEDNDKTQSMYVRQQPEFRRLEAFNKPAMAVKKLVQLLPVEATVSYIGAALVSWLVRAFVCAC